MSTVSLVPDDAGALTGARATPALQLHSLPDTRHGQQEVAAGVTGVGLGRIGTRL